MTKGVRMDVHGLEAFIDALGVVIARSIVVLFFAVCGVVPFLVSLVFLPASFSNWALLVAFLGFLSSTIMAGIGYVFYFLGAKSTKDEQTAIDKLPWPLQAAIGMLSFPFFIMAIGALPIILYSRNKSIFWRDIEFDLLFTYFVSALSFVFVVRLLGSNFSLASTFIVSSGEIGWFDALKFTTDLILKGVIFDVFEHFEINISDIRQTGDFFGLCVTFVLRTTSSGLALSMALDLFRSTRKRLREHEG